MTENNTGIQTLSQAEAQANSFIFYRSFYDALQEIPERERLKVYDAICALAFYGGEKELRGIAKASFMLIKPQILANAERYKNGKKGGRPPKNQTVGFENEKPMVLNFAENQKPNKNENENQDYNYNVNSNFNGAGRSTNTPDNHEDISFLLKDYAKGDSTLHDLLNEWLEVRKVKRTKTPYSSVKMDLSKLEEMALTSHLSVKDYLSEIIRRGWASFYVIADSTPKATPEKHPHETSFDLNEFDDFTLGIGRTEASTG